MSADVATALFGVPPDGYDEKAAGVKASGAGANNGGSHRKPFYQDAPSAGGSDPRAAHNNTASSSSSTVATPATGGASGSSSPASASAAPGARSLRVVWEMESAGCTGFAIEANSILVPFARGGQGNIDMAIISRGHDYCPGTSAEDITLLEEMKHKPVDKWEIDIWVSHRPPSEWPTFPQYVGDDGKVRLNTFPKYIIGRSMYESTVLPASWGEHIKADSKHGGVDAVWVPAQFLIKAFRDHGSPAKSIITMPEAVDTAIFDPSKASPIKDGEFGLHLDKRFNFYSVFKFEPRKGWDVLLDAYWSEFKRSEPVTLTIQTYLPGYGDKTHSTSQLAVILQQFARQKGFNIDDSAVVNVITEFIPLKDMPRMYHSMSAFVLPTRGEGWGLPIIEAMAMGCPTIATNFSGPTEFMTETNSYPIRVERMTDDGYAIPSVYHLRQLMRHVFQNQQDAHAKGAQAQKDVHTKFSRSAVGARYAEEFRRIAQGLNIDLNAK